MGDKCEYKLPFGFTDPQDSERGQLPDTKDESLPPLATEHETAEEQCREKCKEVKVDSAKVCANMRKRMALYLKEHGCPTVITAHKTPAKRCCPKKKK